MSTRKKSAPTSKGRSSYIVGFCKPPVHSRFRPGQSGNPAGRPKGMRNLRTDVRLALKVPVKIKDDGGSRNISTQQGALMVLREKALKGDARALDRLLELAARFNNDPDETAAQTLPADDRATLDAFAAELAAGIAGSTTTTTKSSTRASSLKRVDLRLRETLRRPEQEPSK
jgi:hypothetical protein